MKKLQSEVSEAKELWDEFSNVPIDDNDNILCDWNGFKEGTDRFEILHWFEDTFGISVGEWMYEKEENV